MQDLDGIKGQTKGSPILDLDYDQLCNQFEELFSALEERDRQISETLKEMLAEVEELILLAEEQEDECKFSDEFCR